MVGIAIGSLALWAIKNILKVDSQGWFNNVSAIYQVASTVVIIIAIIAATPERSTSEFVWLSYYNSTGMDNSFYVCLLGMLTCLYGMSGYESSSQMSEETTNASVAAPKGMVNGVLAAIVVGLAFWIGTLYAIGSHLDYVLGNTTSQPIINLLALAFSDGNGSIKMVGALFVAILLLISIFLGGFSHMTVTTRICYAMARDGAIPCSKFIDGVHPTLKVPVKSIIVIFFFESIICLLPLGSTTALTAISSISTIGF
jgi:amino acid transporter